MMKSHQIQNLGNINQLLTVLRKDQSALQYLHQKHMVDALQSADQAITVHLYPIGFSRRRSRSLLELNESNYHQIYLAGTGEMVSYSLAHGRSSGMRESHNFFLDAFLTNKYLRRKVQTMVLAVHEGKPIAYHYHPHFAYCNHDIGTNWENSIWERLGRSNIPYSERRSSLEHVTQILFRDTKGTLTVFQRIANDQMGQRRFAHHLPSKGVPRQPNKRGK